MGLRKIKFRGYNKKNGQWIYGFYLQNRGQHFVCPDEFANGKSWDDYEVDKNTIGQFAGLHDKNGQEIYEGDIVRYAAPNRRGIKRGLYAVTYGDCGFFLKSFSESLPDFIMYGFTDRESVRLEIAGNIYDDTPLSTK